MKRSAKTLVSCALVASAFIAWQPATVGAAEKPVAAERNPPGDIPDTQVFVTYQSPLGFMLKAPEGWAQVDTPKSVSFSDKYNTISVSVSSGAAAPTSKSVASDQASQLQNDGRAVKIVKVRDFKLKGGAAVLISYTSNSDPNPVTNKQIRLEHDRYLFYRDGNVATLDMAAPQGADNVDDWSLIANSFRWN